MTLPVPTSGAINQNAPHRLSGGTEEMTPSLPFGLFGSTQLEPGLVDKGGGLERLSRGLPGQLGGSEFSQLIINQGKKPFGCLLVACIHRLQDLGDLAHGTMGE